MEQLITELRKRLLFKSTLVPGDIVLIAAEDPQLLVFAVVTDITRDSGRKDEWWHVTMQMLSVPLQPMTWTLRMEQMSGQEIFTMGGKERFMAPLDIACKTPGPRSGRKTSKVASGKDKGSTTLRVVK